MYLAQFLGTDSHLLAHMKRYCLVDVAFSASLTANTLFSPLWFTSEHVKQTSSDGP